MPTEFFPTDMVLSSDEGLSRAAEQLSRENRLEFLKGYIRNENLAELVVSLDEATSHIDNEYNRDRLFLEQQSHVADLVWVTKELQGTIAAWGDEERHSVAARARVTTLLSALDKRITELP